MKQLPPRLLMALLGAWWITSTTLSQADEATPVDQYKALVTEYNVATGSGVPLSDQERLQFVGRIYKHHFAVAVKFLELAEKYPDEPVAFDSLLRAVWQVNTTPWPVELVGEDPARSKAFELLQRDHIRSERLAALCQRVSYGFAAEYESFLRAVLANNPHAQVQAVATLSLGHYLHNRQQRLELCRQQRELADEFAELYGREYLETLLHQDPMSKEVEALLTQAAEKYAQVPLDGGETVGQRANVELFEIRHLSVGREAPEIEGVDQDGKPFKLSDYRGKVVLLDFWSYV